MWHLCATSLLIKSDRSSYKSITLLHAIPPLADIQHILAYALKEMLREMLEPPRFLGRISPASSLLRSTERVSDTGVRICRSLS